MNATAFPTGAVVAERYEIRGSARTFPGYVAYRAFDREVEVEVALWCVDASLMPSDDDRARVLAAARASRRLKNQGNVRRLFDAALSDGLVFITAQLATGQRLADQLAKGEPADEAELRRYSAAICNALTSAHDQGVMHGRLVPTDVVQVSGRIKVGGIGLWLEAAPAAVRAAWGDAARFVAPEAWERDAITPRSDVFSAAAVIAELACGGANAWHESGDPRDLKEELALSRGDLAVELSAALDADPGKRPATAAALLVSLRAVLGPGEELAPTGQHTPVPDPGPVVELVDDEVSGPAPIVVDDEPHDEPPAQDPTTKETVVGGPGVRDDDKTNHFVRIDEVDGAPTPGDGDDPDVLTSAPIIPPVPKPIRRNASERLQLPLEAEPSGEFAPVTDDTPPVEVVLVADAPDEELGTDGGARSPGDDEDEFPTDAIDVEATPAESDASDEDPEPSPPPTPPVVEPPAPRAPTSRLGSEPIGEVVGPARIAPPSMSQRMQSPRVAGGLLPYAIIGTLAAVAVAVLVWFGLSRVMDDDKPETPAPASTGPASPPPEELDPVVVSPGPAGPCPAVMALVEDADEDDGEGGASTTFCIDKHESPGEGRQPETGVTLAQARAACAKRSARLCSGDEWERACRGPTGASFPYGTAYRTVCNSPVDEPGSAVPSGSMADCVSAEGVFDLSGNVAEWVDTGRARGGSAADGRDGRCSRRRKPSTERGHSDIGFRCCADPVAERR